MKLGTFFDHNETLDREFKEFCLKTEIKKIFSKCEIYQIIKNGVLPGKFNKIVLNNIKLYIQSYFPKYICSFHNNKDAVFHRMNIYIGIDDHSEITGIPFNGDLTKYKENFLKLIKDVVDKYTETCCIKYELHVKKCELDYDILDDNSVQMLLNEYDSIRDKYDLEYANYVGRKKKWIVDMQIYKGKLTNVIDNNELYIEFIDYLKINEKYELFKNELDVNNIIAHEVRYCKNDKTSLLYWIIKFKDEHVRQLIIDKPIQPVSPKILNADVCILTQLSCLRKRLLLKNDKLEYYVIILEIYKNNKCDKLTSYYDRKKKQYRCVCRTVINNEPRNNVI